MASNENGAPGSIPDQLWRLGQVQRDVLRRLDKMEDKLDRLENASNEQRWRMDAIDNRLGTLERKRTNGGAIGSLLGESPLVRTIFLSLLAMVGALATGTWLSTMGFFK